MKRNISILLIVSCIFSIFTLSLFAEEAKYDFRQTNWGMSKEQVKARENKEVIDEGDFNLGHIVCYEIEIGTKDYICAYGFLENKLYRTVYVFNEKYSNDNDYIKEYEYLKEILTKKYGDSNKKLLMDLYGREEIFWKDDVYKDDKTNWGFAISAGDLIYSSFWETTNTRIEVLLDGNEYEITLRVVYGSKELKEWSDKILEERAKSNF